MQTLGVFEPEKQFLSTLKYFSENQNLWEQLFPCDPASDIEKNFGELFQRLCDEGRYDLALHAVYACRTSKAVSNALTKVFVALLMEQIEREGMDKTRELLTTSFASANK